MKVYPVFKSDGFGSSRVYTFATKELAEGYCTAISSSEKDERTGFWYSKEDKCIRWWYFEENVVDEPFWMRKDEE